MCEVAEPLFPVIAVKLGKIAIEPWKFPGISTMLSDFEDSS
jgi:hypothetical protein